MYALLKVLHSTSRTRKTRSGYEYFNEHSKTVLVPMESVLYFVVANKTRVHELLIDCQSVQLVSKG